MTFDLRVTIARKNDQREDSSSRNMNEHVVHAGDDYVDADHTEEEPDDLFNIAHTKNASPETLKRWRVSNITVSHSYTKYMKSNTLNL